MNRVEHLEQMKRDVAAAIDEAIITLKGSVEFRDAVEALLVGTPHEKPADTGRDFHGLYGRLRNALASGAPQRTAEGWRPIATAPKDGTLIIGALIRDDKVWRVHEMKHNGLAFYTTSGGSLPQMTHWVPMPSSAPGITPPQEEK